jgi:hypothetical protein
VPERAKDQPSIAIIEYKVKLQRNSCTSIPPRQIARERAKDLPSIAIIAYKVKLQRNSRTSIPPTHYSNIDDSHYSTPNQ